jgi:ABC-type transport system involved in multi-copper enzyme maturation permease subunit
MDTQGRLNERVLETRAAPPVPPPPAPPTPALSPLRAWCYLVWLSFQRQARARQMVWIALALLTVTATVVALNTAGSRWGMDHWRSPRGMGPSFRQWLEDWTASTTALPGGAGPGNGILAAAGAALQKSGFVVFTNWMVYSVFLSFLLPIFSLSFATEALGSERESRSLVWLLSRPLPRASIYLAKFVALLPWALAMNVGGFALICLAAGAPGQMALRLFWLPVVGATLAFCALFHLMGALFRRAAVVAIVYSFFLETVFGNLPGYLKRGSIGFYTRCLMFSSAEEYGVLPPERPQTYWPVQPATAWLVLALATVLLLVIGTVIFSRTEYRDES